MREKCTRNILLTDRAQRGNQRHTRRLCDVKVELVILPRGALHQLVVLLAWSHRDAARRLRDVRGPATRGLRSMEGRNQDDASPRRAQRALAWQTLTGDRRCCCC